MRSNWMPLAILGAVIVLISVVLLVSAPTNEARTPESAIESEYLSQDAPEQKDRFQEGKYALERFSGDGDATILSLRSKYDDMTVYLNGEVVPFGTYADGCESIHGLCYDFDNKRLYFVRPLATGATVVIRGFPVE